MIPPPIQQAPRRRFPWVIVLVAAILVVAAGAMLARSARVQSSANLDRAVARAQRELPTFIDRLSKRRSEERFFVRGRFGPAAAPEILWVRNVVYDRGNFRGQVDQEPRLLREPRRGDDVTVKSQDVMDWAIRTGPQIEGAYTEANAGHEGE